MDRQATAVNVTLWPVPDDSSFTLSYYRLRGISGVSSGIGTSADVPPRFVPCLVSGLAYYISLKKPEVAARVAPLKQEYEFQFELAAGEDSDSSSIKFVPYDTFYLEANMPLVLRKKVKGNKKKMPKAPPSRPRHANPKHPMNTERTTGRNMARKRVAVN